MQYYIVSVSCVCSCHDYVCTTVRLQKKKKKKKLELIQLVTRVGFLRRFGDSFEERKVETDSKYKMLPLPPHAR